ncbi:unnamed protein product [Zymoseptoria tritici ST99CH_3D7]|uniref:FAD-binding domain-containing protein n=1 Tax=Zymoseptoria tritici (strain ST99CH_3D7) TaxID=1276538 RepID=A0A1X7S0V9_ZYMT9|nr:unnamed protein product [Zymoseptoria tritici ST99CH_3D7]
MASSQAHSPLAGKVIIVSGAGIAGLAFVISMRTIWRPEMGKFPNIKHYEREDGPSGLSREGYSMSIRSDEMSEGIQALQKMQVLDKLMDVSIFREGIERGYFGLWSLDWSRLAIVRDTTPPGVPKSGMRVARTKLRQVLLDEASKYGEISWGTSCTKATSMDDGTYAVELSDGTKDTCGFIIVADGASSKLRACIKPDEKLSFAGPVTIGAVSRFEKDVPQVIKRDWGIVASGQGVAFFASPMFERTSNWALSYMADIPRTELRQPIPLEQCKQLIEEVKGRGKMFQEPFQSLIKNSDLGTLMVFNNMDKQPFAHGTINGVPDGVFFIGDSNHAVSPFAGNGANMALKDGFDLAECLCIYSSIQEAASSYDMRSIPRAATSVRFSHGSIAVIHSTGWTWKFYRSLLVLFGMAMSIWYSFQDVCGAFHSWRNVL